MVDLEKIKELVQLMVDNDLIEVSLRDGAEEVSLKRPSANAALPPATNPPLAPAVRQQEPELAEAPPPEEPQVTSDDGLVPICSPMVGTFYSSPNPDAPPYVEVGSQITADTVVCIVEAMKVFNEIKAEVSGTVEKLLAENHQAVEYGQDLFLVRSSA